MMVYCRQLKLKEFIMNSKFLRIAALLLAAALCLSALFSLSGCKKERTHTNTPGSSVIYDKYGNTVPAPTDNDLEGWFSAEVLNQYSVAGFTIPEGTEVTSKPEKNSLYLKGNNETLVTSTEYAFEAISIANDKVYLPVYTTGDDGIPTVSSLKEIKTFSVDNLYPTGEDTTVTFIYKSGHNAYQCTIELEYNATEGEQVCITFLDKTEEYLPLM